MSDFKTDVERIVMYMINVNGITLHEEEKAHKVLDEAKKYFIKGEKDKKKGCGKLYKENGDKMCWEGCELCPECRKNDKGLQDEKN